MTEGKLKGLFGGGEADDARGAQRAERQARRAARGDGGGQGGRRRRSPEDVAQAEDFINRYTTGHPSEGFSSEEAVNYLRQVRNEAPPEVMQRAAVETVRRRARRRARRRVPSVRPHRPRRRHRRGARPAELMRAPRDKRRRARARR